MKTFVRNSRSKKGSLKEDDNGLNYWLNTYLNNNNGQLELNVIGDEDVRVQMSLVASRAPSEKINRRFSF